MDYRWSWVEFIWRLLQPVGTLAMAVVMFLWWLGFRENKNSTIEAKEAQLALKEDQLKSKEEQLNSKGEQLKSKDEQIKAVEQKNDLLRLLTVEAMQKNMLTMKTYYEGQIEQLQNEKRAIESLLEDAQRRRSLSPFRNQIEAFEASQEVDDLANKLRLKEQELTAFQRAEKTFRHMALHDLYGPVGQWVFHVKWRDSENAIADEEFVIKVPKIKTIGPAPADLEREAMDDWINATVEDAIAWAKREVGEDKGSQTAQNGDEKDE
jgi:hypothetical protein